MEVTAHAENGQTCVVTVAPDETVLSLKAHILEKLPCTGQMALQLQSDAGIVSLDGSERVCDTPLEAGGTVHMKRYVPNITTGLLGRDDVFTFWLSPCGRRIALTYRDDLSLLHLLSTESHTPLSQHHIRNAPSFSPCGDFLCFCDTTLLINTIDTQCNTVLHSTRHHDVTTSTAWTDCGKTVLAVSHAHQGLEAWHAASGAPLYSCSEVIGRSLQAIGGCAIVVAGGDLEVWDVKGGLVMSLAGVGAVSPAGGNMVATMCGAVVTTWDISRGCCVHCFPFPEADTPAGGFFAVSVSDTGMLAASDGFAVHVWSLHTAALIHSEPCVYYDMNARSGTVSEDCVGLAISPCGTKLFVQTSSGIQVSELEVK